MRKLTEREEMRKGRGLLHGHIPFHLPPLASPIELAQAMCAVGSGVSARSINLRLGEAWSPDEVSWAVQCIGQRATTFLSSCPRGRPRILDTQGRGEAEEAPAGVTPGKPVAGEGRKPWCRGLSCGSRGSGPRPDHSL